MQGCAITNDKWTATMQSYNTEHCIDSIVLISFQNGFSHSFMNVWIHMGVMVLSRLADVNTDGIQPHFNWRTFGDVVSFHFVHKFEGISMQS